MTALHKALVAPKLLPCQTRIKKEWKRQRKREAGEKVGSDVAEKPEIIVNVEAESNLRKRTHGKAQYP